MKNIIKILIIAFVAIVSASCLKHDFETLDVYTDSEITGVQGVYWRYFGTEKLSSSGEFKVHQVRIPSGHFKSNEEEGICEFDFKLHSSFPSDQLSSFTVEKLVVVLNISTAANIVPIEGAPDLGKPGDWTKENKYKVTAADGTSKIWTVKAKQIK